MKQISSATSSPIKRKNVEIQTSPFRESTSNWANITGLTSSPIPQDKKVKDSFFNPTSLLKQRALEKTTNLSELLLTNESLPIFASHSISQTNFGHKAHFGGNTNWGLGQNAVHGGCCCLKDKLICDYQAEIQKLQEQFREKDNKNYKEISRLKTKLQGIRVNNMQFRGQYSNNLKQIKYRIMNGLRSHELINFLQKMIDDSVSVSTAQELDDFDTEEEDINTKLHDDLLSFRLKINH